MPHAYQIHKQEAAYFMTLTTINWVDIFTRDSYKQLLCESLNYCIEKKGLEVFCYVIMTSHMHMIARAKNSDLSKVMRDFKKYTSGSLIHEIRMGRESRKEWLLKMLEEGGDKQTKKSLHQLWQYNNPACILFRQAGMQKKYTGTKLIQLLEKLKMQKVKEIVLKYFIKNEIDERDELNEEN